MHHKLMLPFAVCCCCFFLSHFTTGPFSQFLWSRGIDTVLTTVNEEVLYMTCSHVNIMTSWQNSKSLLTSIYIGNWKEIKIHKDRKILYFSPCHLPHCALLYHCISICQDKLCMQSYQHSPARHIIKKKRITSASFQQWNNKNMS